MEKLQTYNREENLKDFREGNVKNIDHEASWILAPSTETHDNYMRKGCGSQNSSGTITVVCRQKCAL